MVLVTPTIKSPEEIEADLQVYEEDASAWYVGQNLTAVVESNAAEVWEREYRILYKEFTSISRRNEYY